MDYAQQIIQCYNCLIDTKDIDQATRLLMDFYKEEEAYPVLISILNSNQKEVIKRHAAIGLQRVLNYKYKIFRKIDAEYFKPLFLLISTLNSFIVVEYLVSIINEHTPDPELLEMIIEFCVQTANSNGDIGESSYNYSMAIFASLLLVNFNLPAGLIGVTELGPVYQKLIGLGFETHNLDIEIAAISCAFSLTSICEDALGFGPVFPQSIARLQTLIGSPYINKLFVIFSNGIMKHCPLISIQMLIPELLAIVSHDKSSPEERRRAYFVIIDILTAYKDEIFAPFSSKSDDSTQVQVSFVTPIFQTTIGLISTFFVHQDEYALSPYDIVKEISELFSPYPALLQSFWEQVPFLQQFPFGVFTIILFINFSLDQGYEFYESKLTSIIETCCQVCSTTDSPCLLQASILTLEDLSITFTDSISHLASPMQEAVFQALIKQPSIELLISFSEFVTKIDDSDPIIDKGCEFLTGLLQHPEVSIDLKEQALWAIASLIKHSQYRINDLLPNLVTMFKAIIDEYESNKETTDCAIASAAVYSLARICQKCPKGFAPFAEQFAGFLVANVEQAVALLHEASQSEEQVEAPIRTNFVIQCINAYSYLALNIVESTDSTIERMIPLLISLCELPNHQTETEIQIAIIFDQISIQDISLRVLCGCLSKYPYILPDLLEKVFQFINVPLYHAAIGAKLIAETITALPNRAEAVPRLVDIAISNINKSTDSDCTATFFQTLCTLIDWCGTEAIKPEVFETAEKAFKFNNLPCFSHSDQYSEKVHESAQLVFRYSIKTLQNMAYQTLQPYIPTFVELLNESNKRMRDLSLHLLAELIQHTDGSILPNDFLHIVLVVSQNELMKDNPFAYFAVKNLSASSPFNFTFSEVFRSLIPILMQRLYSSQTEEHSQSNQELTSADNCLSALGSILMNVLGDSLFEQFDIFDSVQNEGANIPLYMTFDDKGQPTGRKITSPIISVLLNAIPAKIDVAENVPIMDFFLWLFEHCNGRSLPEFGAVLVKLFSVPIDELKESKEFDDVTISKLLPLLAQLIQNLGGEQFCFTVLEGNAEKLDILKSYLAS